MRLYGVNNVRVNLPAKQQQARFRGSAENSLRQSLGRIAKHNTNSISIKDGRAFFVFDTSPVGKATVLAANLQQGLVGEGSTLKIDATLPTIDDEISIRVGKPGQHEITGKSQWYSQDTVNLSDDSRFQSQVDYTVNQLNAVLLKHRAPNKEEGGLAESLIGVCTGQFKGGNAQVGFNFDYDHGVTVEPLQRNLDPGSQLQITYQLGSRTDTMTVSIGNPHRISLAHRAGAHRRFEDFTGSSYMQGLASMAIQRLSQLT